MAGILILIVLQSGPSEDNEEDVLELSDDSDQPAFPKSEHHGTISPRVGRPRECAPC